MKPTTEALAEYKDAASKWACERLADTTTVVRNNLGLYHKEVSSGRKAKHVIEEGGSEEFEMNLDPPRWCACEKPYNMF